MRGPSDHAGAQQPGLTGQVKEGILCRFGELGVGFEAGCLGFRPRLLCEAEFAGVPDGDHALEPGTIAFTISRTPVRYHRRDDLDDAVATLVLDDGTKCSVPGGVLDTELTDVIVRQTGRVVRIEVGIPSSWLLS